MVVKKEDIKSIMAVLETSSPSDTYTNETSLDEAEFEHLLAAFDDPMSSGTPTDNSTETTGSTPPTRSEGSTPPSSTCTIHSTASSSAPSSVSGEISTPPQVSRFARIGVSQPSVPDHPAVQMDTIAVDQISSIGGEARSAVQAVEQHIQQHIQQHVHQHVHQHNEQAVEQNVIDEVQTLDSRFPMGVPSVFQQPKVDIYHIPSAFFTAPEGKFSARHAAALGRKTTRKDRIHKVAPYPHRAETYQGARSHLPLPHVPTQGGASESQERMVLQPLDANTHLVFGHST